MFFLQNLAIAGSRRRILGVLEANFGVPEANCASRVAFLSDGANPRALKVPVPHIAGKFCGLPMGWSAIGVTRNIEGSGKQAF